MEKASIARVSGGGAKVKNKSREEISGGGGK